MRVVLKNSKLFITDFKSLDLNWKDMGIVIDHCRISTEALHHIFITLAGNYFL